MANHKEKNHIEKFHAMKLDIEKAVQLNQVFSVLGPFKCVKESLKARGWIEKFDIRNHAFNQQNSNKILSNKEISSDINKSTHDDNILVYRLLRDYPANLLWTMRNEIIKWKKIHQQTLVSRFPRAEFTSKIGLCNILNQVYWYNEEGVSLIRFPRCYDISNEEEFEAFLEEFRFTACTSLLKYIYEAVGNKQIIFTEEGTVPLISVKFAIARCEEYIELREHKDIDRLISQKISHCQWEQFITWFHSLLHEDKTFLKNDENEIQEIYNKCVNVLDHLNSMLPQLHMDGNNNLWILKPAAKSRGRGIQIMKKLDDVILKIGSFHSKDTKYVIQKYMERPLLIYHTKFDIRQWFLVTSASPLVVWMYKESYLRFCSQMFSLKNVHESVHLSNNAVQCKYKNGQRDSKLPDENMWDCYTFQTYLRSKEKAEMWEKVIYPGMRQNIIGALLASQDTMDTRKNCFELFGADFMLSEDYVPWLIEINSGPSMTPSTSVTARMCIQVLEDVIKVVVDRKNDCNADIGMFELAYKQNMPPPQPYMGQNLIVKGTRIEDYNKLNNSHKSNRKNHIKITKGIKSENLKSNNISEQISMKNVIIKEEKNDRNNNNNKTINKDNNHYENTKIYNLININETKQYNNSENQLCPTDLKLFKNNRKSSLPKDGVKNLRFNNINNKFENNFKNSENQYTTCSSYENCITKTTLNFKNEINMIESFPSVDNNGCKKIMPNSQEFYRKISQSSNTFPDIIKSPNGR